MPPNIDRLLYTSKYLQTYIHTSRYCGTCWTYFNTSNTSIFYLCTCTLYFQLYIYFTLSVLLKVHVHIFSAQYTNTFWDVVWRRNMTLLVLDRGRETQSCDRLRLPTSAVGDGSLHPLILSALHLFILLGCLLLCLCCDCRSVCNITFAMRSRLSSVWFVEVRRGWYLKTKTIFTRKLFFF